MSASPISYENTNRLLVALPPEEYTQLFEYAAFICGALQINQVCFFHVAKSLVLPEELVKKYPNLVAPTYERLKQQFSEAIDQHFKPEEPVETSVEVHEGNLESKILYWAKTWDADLVLFGRKDDGKNGSMADSIAHKIGCHALFLPDSAPNRLDKIMVALDFSDYSELSLQYAWAIKKQVGCEVEALHVYEVPLGYHKLGKSFEEFAKIMEGHAEKEFQVFAKNTLGEAAASELKCHFLLEDEQSKSELIYYGSKKANADILIIGSKGRTAASSVLFGSVAEKVLRINMQVPLFIVRKKGETVSFFEALFNL